MKRPYTVYNTESGKARATTQGRPYGIMQRERKKKEHEVIFKPRRGAD